MKFLYFLIMGKTDCKHKIKISCSFLYFGWFFSLLLLNIVIFLPGCLQNQKPDMGDYSVVVNTTEGVAGVPGITDLSSVNAEYPDGGLPSQGTDTENMQNVINWWANHRFNPKHTNTIDKIKSPTPVIDVYADFDGDIQKALDSLPATGGTLFFAPTVFIVPQSGLYLHSKNNVHFVSDPDRPATIAATSEKTMVQLECGPGDLSGYPDCYYKQTHNYLFANLIFDGRKKSNKAISLYSVKDIVIKNCTFKDFLTHKQGGDAMIHSGAWADNIWIMDSVFTGQGKHALILDGTHYSGILRSRFDHDIYPVSIVFLSNDDLSRDVNWNDVWDGKEIRLANYVVIEDNTFGQTGTNSVSAINGHLRNVLIQNNTMAGNGHFFVKFDARCSQIEVNKNLIYYFYYHNIINNTITGNLNYFVEYQDAHNSNCVAPGSTSYLGKYTIQGNLVNGTIHKSAIIHHNSDHGIKSPIDISGNKYQNQAANWTPATE